MKWEVLLQLVILTNLIADTFFIPHAWFLSNYCSKNHGQFLGSNNCCLTVLEWRKSRTLENEPNSKTKQNKQRHNKPNNKQRITHFLTTLGKKNLKYSRLWKHFQVCCYPQTLKLLTISWFLILCLLIPPEVLKHVSPIYPQAGRRSLLTAWISLEFSKPEIPPNILYALPVWNKGVQR